MLSLLADLGYDALSRLAILAMLAASGSIEAAEAEVPQGPPVVAGYDRLREDQRTDPGAAGEILLGELNCLMCHAAPGQKLHSSRRVRQTFLKWEARVTPQFLRAYLASPHSTKPARRCRMFFMAWMRQRARTQWSPSPIISSQWEVRLCRPRRRAMPC